MRITIFKKKFISPVAWGVLDEENIQGEIGFYFHWERGYSFWFSIVVPNKSFGGKNPFKVISEAIESQSVGMGKYDRLKDKLRATGIWKRL